MRIPHTLLPMKAGGTNFCTHRLASGLGNRVEFRATAGAKLFCLLFLFVGLGVLAGAFVMAVKQGTSTRRRGCTRNVP